MRAHRILAAEPGQEEIDAARQPDDQHTDPEPFEQVAATHSPARCDPGTNAPGPYPLLLDRLDLGVDQIPGQVPARAIDVRIVLRRPALPVGRVHANAVVE